MECDQRHSLCGKQTEHFLPRRNSFLVIEIGADAPAGACEGNYTIVKHITADQQALLAAFEHHAHVARRMTGGIDIAQPGRNRVA